MEKQPNYCERKSEHRETRRSAERSRSKCVDITPRYHDTGRWHLVDCQLQRHKKVPDSIKTFKAFSHLLIVRNSLKSSIQVVFTLTSPSNSSNNQFKNVRENCKNRYISHEFEFYEFLYHRWRPRWRWCTVNFERTKSRGKSCLWAQQSPWKDHFYIVS